MKHFISVIIPVYNGKQYLTEAVESIFQQNYDPLEIIIVDDGSTDGTADLKNSFGKKVKYIYQENSGPAAARNKGISLANGEYIAFLDSDDLWPSGKLETQINQMIHNPDIEIILGHTKTFDSELTDANKIKVEQDSVISIQLGSALFRKSVFEKVGPFDEELHYSEDHDWFFRAREKGIPILVSEEITLYYRRHKNNMTDDLLAHGYQLTTVIKKSLDRRRQKNLTPDSLPKLSDYIRQTD